MDSVEESVEFAAAMDDLRSEQAAAEAQGTAVGALFRYELPEPVSVPDRGSALVSLLSRRLSVEEVVLFRSEDFHGNSGGIPYRAVRLKNDTGLTLETGAVAIYGDGTFLGESFLERAPNDSTAFLTFAKDDHVSLEVQVNNRQEASRLLKIVAGVLHTEVLNVRRSHYIVNNRRDAAVTTFIKVPKLAGYSLRTNTEGAVETDGAYFLPVQLESSSKTSLETAWVQPLRKTLSIDTDLGAASLKLFVDGGRVPASIAGAIAEVLRQRGEIAEIEREYGRIMKQRQAMTEEQARVRENLNLLRKSRGNQDLQHTLNRRLAELEGLLGQYAGSIVRLSEEKAALERAMRQVMQGITMD